MKAKVTITFEYDINLRSYGVTTAEEAIAIDRRGFESDPGMAIDTLYQGGVPFTIKVEPVE